MITVPARALFAWHLSAVGFLGGMHLLVITADALGHHNLMGISQLFRLSDEGNMPAMFSALALALAAIVSLTVAARMTADDREGKRWRWLGFLFVFLAGDEAMQFHEMIDQVHTLGDIHGVFYSLAVFPYALIALGLAIVYWRWWLHQVSTVRVLIACGGALYVASAVGVEMLENLLKTDGIDKLDPRRGLLFFLEETGEMLAVALMLYAFMLRLAALGGGTVSLFAIRSQEADRALQYGDAGQAVRGEGRA